MGSNILRIQLSCSLRNSTVQTHTCIYHENYILNMELQETCKYYASARIEGKFNRDDYYGEINAIRPSNKNNNSQL